MRFQSFPHFKQFDSMDCGPTCIRMIAHHYGKDHSIQSLRQKCFIDKAGVSLAGINEAAENIGFRALPVKVQLKSANSNNPSLSDAPLPCIVHWNQNHFVVVYKITGSHVFIADPGADKIKLTHAQFQSSFCSDNDEGVALLLETTPAFFEEKDEHKKANNISYILSYLSVHSKLLFQVLIGLLLGTLFQLIFPFLTQSLVDKGIETNDLNFIYVILAAQLVLIFSQTIVKFLQSWIILHISVRLNVSMISDYLVKLMRLNISYFDSRNTGDIMQRISDHKRIESFMTNSILATLLSIVNLIVFSVVLLTYNQVIFFIFSIAAVLYISWILLFMAKRKEIDYVSFQHMSDNQDALYEIVQGMQEIKLQGSHYRRRWGWTDIQAKLLKVQMKSLALMQYQDAGAQFINHVKDALITFIAAKAVIDGSLTLGMMLSIQYIIGQMTSPLQQLVGFLRSAQDASISYDRIKETLDEKTEDEDDENKLDTTPSGDIVFENLSFKYSDLPDAPSVLKNINCTIQRGKTTAIVGTSGSGKTTMIKLMLGFYNVKQGSIKIGKTPMHQIKVHVWREKCGVVMQDGFIFYDTIAQNIAESDMYIDNEKVKDAIKAANLSEFIDDLPLGLNTKIGSKGNGISQGQRQRNLIARAIYKNPEILFFDEATNALDANNEKVIMENLNQFLQGKTAVIVAHRLSTVKNADHIIVLEKGEVIEEGTHKELIARKGQYFTLIQNQLELGE